MIGKGPKRWPHQVEALRFIHQHRGSLLWVPMRAGKTRIAIDYIQNTEPGNTLIVCPHKVIRVWSNQFGMYLEKQYDYGLWTLGDVSIADRAQIITSALTDTTFSHKVFVVNYDVIANEPLASTLMKTKWNRIIFDEVHRLQAPGGKQSRFTAKLCKNAEKVIGLSGTPGNPLGNPQKPEMRDAGILDLYGVMRTLAPGLFAYNYEGYKRKYGVWNAFTPFPKIEGYQNHQDFDYRLAQVCYHVTEEDLCYTLPEAIEQIRPVTLPPAVQTAYATMENDLYADWDDEEMTASNALVKQLRLQQMTAGFFQPDAETPEQLIHTEKFDAVKEIIEDIPAEERVIVFCQFKPEMDELTARLKATKRSIFHIRGGVDTSDWWKETPGAILIVQIQAGGEGLDLSMTNYCIYNSLCHSLRAYQQSFKRPMKANKKHPIAYYYVMAEGTIDGDIYEAQQAKEQVVDSVRQRMKARH
jgi:SNF2 family DNA or RNA helicase